MGQEIMFPGAFVFIAKQRQPIPKSRCSTPLIGQSLTREAH
jgi:hypothetical protein